MFIPAAVHSNKDTVKLQQGIGASMSVCVCGKLAGEAQTVVESL